MKELIDLSYHNGDIDFTKVVQCIDGVILREGYRKQIDPKFISYVSACRDNNIKIYAIYHFIYALNVDDVILEAITCVQNAMMAGFVPGDDIIIFADYEYDTIENAQKYGTTLTKHDCNQITEAFCAAITNLGFKPGVYMNLDFYKNYYIDEIKNKYPIWLADYTGDADFLCSIHQYTNSGTIPGIKGSVDMNQLFEEVDNLSVDSDSEPTRAKKVIELADSWLGKNEKDGSYKEIIDIYNSYKGSFPRGVKMQYGWSWCACTWSALAIKLGYTNIMPIEISCGYLVEAATNMGCWIERDDYIPKPGDAVLYDWQDYTVYNTDCTGWPDHVGLVVYVDEPGGYFVTIEGNYDDAVKKRTVSINGKYIRGFIHPKYDIEDATIIGTDCENRDIDTIAHEVIAGNWGNGINRKTLLESKGYDYSEVQKRVNEILNGSAANPEDPNTDLNQPYSKKVISSCLATGCNTEYCGTYVTTANLYLRNDAGTNMKALAIIPKGTTVQCKGCYNMSNNVPWLYVNFIMNGVYYGGFSSSKYLVMQ